MSINHFMDKIKGKIGLDSSTLLCLLVIMLVGLSSFGLGRLSAINNQDKEVSILENTNSYVVKEAIGKSEVKSSIKSVVGNMQKVEEITKEKMYVASKNGKLYYTVNCSGAKRIAEKNKVWFATSTEAEKAGYSLSSSCK